MKETILLISMCVTLFIWRIGITSYTNLVLDGRFFSTMISRWYERLAYYILKTILLVISLVITVVSFKSLMMGESIGALAFFFVICIILHIILGLHHYSLEGKKSKDILDKTGPITVYSLIYYYFTQTFFLIKLTDIFYNYITL